MPETPAPQTVERRRSAAAEVAVEAFRQQAKTEFAFDRATKALSEAAFLLGNDPDSTDEDRADYLRLTNEIVAEYEAKRAKAGL